MSTVLIPDLERHIGDTFQVGDEIVAWRHRLKIIERFGDTLKLRIDADHSCVTDALPADTTLIKRREL